VELNKNLVLVRVQSAKEQTDSGVFIQEEWQSKPPVGVVEAVAKDVVFCKVGDKVWFERYTSIQHPEDKDLRMCREDAILAIL
jgi:co-chaperonin GroES (HSP10)